MNTFHLPLFFFLLPFFGLTQSPGGVNTNLQLWLRADKDVYEDRSGNVIGSDLAEDGDVVQSWGDQSGSRTNDATDAEATITGPLFDNDPTTNINYNPRIDFMDADLIGLNLADDYIFSTNNGLSILSVVSARHSSGLQYVVDFGNNASRAYQVEWYSDQCELSTPTLTPAPPVVRTIPSHSFGTNTTIFSSIIDFASDQVIYLNGENVGSNSISIGQLGAVEINEHPTRGSDRGPFTIGGQAKTSAQSGRFFDGYILELIVYDEDLDELTGNARNQIESYLAIKYGITLDNSGGGTNGDYAGSTGSLIWDADLNSAYHNNVIGIVRSDDSDFMQKQAHTGDDTTRVYICSLATDNNSNTGSFSGDEEYLILGDNRDRMCATVAANIESPASIVSRIEREWKVTNSGFNSSFNVDFKLSGCAEIGMITASDLRLLVDTDGDFSDAAVYSIADGLSFAESGELVTISGINTAHIPANSTVYITLGSISFSTPLPITLLDFDARINDNQVDVSWETASEFNNDYFEIQRSENGTDYEVIATVNGAQNSSSLHSYFYPDHHPLEGISYYRLRQVDLDGEYQYSSTRSVTRSVSQELIIYPNPTKSGHEITIEYGNNSPDNSALFNLYDSQGRIVLTRIYSLESGTNKFTVSTDQLSSGTYHFIWISESWTEQNKLILY